MGRAFAGPAKFGPGQVGGRLRWEYVRRQSGHSRLSARAEILGRLQLGGSRRRLLTAIPAEPSARVHLDRRSRLTRLRRASTDDSYGGTPGVPVRAWLTHRAKSWAVARP